MLPCSLPMRPTDSSPLIPLNLSLTPSAPNTNTQTLTQQLPSSRVRSFVLHLEKNQNLLNYYCPLSQNKIVVRNRCTISRHPCVIVAFGVGADSEHMGCVWAAGTVRWPCVYTWAGLSDVFLPSDHRLASLSVSHHWTMKVDGLLTKIILIVAQRKGVFHSNSKHT